MHKKNQLKTLILNCTSSLFKKSKDKNNKKRIKWSLHNNKNNNNLIIIIIIINITKAPNFNKKLRKAKTMMAMIRNKKN